MEPVQHHGTATLTLSEKKGEDKWVQFGFQHGGWTCFVPEEMRGDV